MEDGLERGRVSVMYEAVIEGGDLPASHITHAATAANVPLQGSQTAVGEGGSPSPARGVKEIEVVKLRRRGELVGHRALAEIGHVERLAVEGDQAGVPFHLLADHPHHTFLLAVMPGEELPESPPSVPLASFDPSAELRAGLAQDRRRKEAPPKAWFPPSPLPPLPQAPTPPVFRATPVARRMAEERGVDLSTIVGTGPGGRITKTDVEAALLTLSPAAEVPHEKVRATPAGRRIAREQGVPLKEVYRAAMEAVHCETTGRDK